MGIARRYWRLYVTDIDTPASGLRFREISEMMKTPLNTTLGRMHNATRRLKEWLGEPQAVS